MKRWSTAALLGPAALCGLLALPAAADAQLKCTNPETDIQIRRVSFQGNESFTASQLAFHVVSTPTDQTRQFFGKRAIPGGAVLGTVAGAIIKAENRPAGAFWFGVAGTVAGIITSSVAGVPRCIRPGLLAGDANNLRVFYADQGFPDARVDTASHVDQRWVDITFRIREGNPAVVDSMAVVGGDSAVFGDLPTRLKSRKGGRFSPAFVREDIDSLETRLHNSGYPAGQVLQSVDFNVPKYHAVVQFAVQPGPRARIGQISIVDTRIDGSKPAVEEQVIRDLLRFGTGDVYSERVLFESGRRFYRVGSFLSADVVPDTSHLMRDSLVDVTVTLLEDLTHTGSIEPGFGTLDCLRLNLGYSDKAFLHGLNRLDLSASMSKIGWAPRWPITSQYLCTQLRNDQVSSNAINYNATVRISRPLPLRGGLLPSLSAYTERRGAYQAYLRTTRIGSALSFTKAITRTVVAEPSYNFEFGHTDAAQSVLCFLFRACDESARAQFIEGDKRLAVLGVSFARDLRNSIDSASAGTALRLELRKASQAFGSDPSLTFNKGLVDAAWYHRSVGSSVIAVRLRGGLVSGGQATSGGRLPPLQERLFAGGENSVRGFAQNELGPLVYVTSDTAKLALAASPADRIDSLKTLTLRTIPAGGNAMYVGNFEWRIQAPFLRTLQIIPFVDVGRLWTRGLTTTTDTVQTPRWTPGLAFKYFSPIGAIQANIGYNGYQRTGGPVYLDEGIDPNNPNKPLVCLSGTDAAGQCLPTSAFRREPSFLKRLTLSVAFRPDF